MPAAFPGNSTTKLARAATGGGFESAIGLASGIGPVVDNGDGTITLTGSGFGNTGPIFVANLDAANGTSGTLSNSEVVKSSDTTITSGGLPIVDEPKLIGGKGIQVGSLGTDLGSTTWARYRVIHPATTRCFESRTTYFPLAHSQKASDYFAGALPDPDPNGSNDNQDWQIKPVWNLANEEFGPSDTNFFIRMFEGRFGPGFTDCQKISSNSIPSDDLCTTEDRLVFGSNFYNGRRLPLDEPYTVEFTWDQGSLDSDLDGTFGVEIYSSEFGPQTKNVYTGRDLVLTSGPVRHITDFVYPGYVRGFNIDLNCNLIETQVFRQIGPGAYCRVALCDSADYSLAKKRVLLPVQQENWSDTEITADLPLWSPTLLSFSGWFMCAVGIDNNQIGTGVQL